MCVGSGGLAATAPVTARCRSSRPVPGLPVCGPCWATGCRGRGGGEEARTVVLRTRTTRGVLSPGRLAPRGLLSYHPRGRQEGACGTEGFGRATSGFLFSGLLWWQGAGGREQGVHWLPEEEQLKDVSTGPETRGKEASPKRVLFASTNAPCHVHSGSSEALLADALVTSRLCRGRCKEGGGGSVGSEGCLSP